MKGNMIFLHITVVGQIDVGVPKAISSNLNNIRIQKNHFSIFQPLPLSLYKKKIMSEDRQTCQAAYS